MFLKKLLNVAMFLAFCSATSISVAQAEEVSKGSAGATPEIERQITSTGSVNTSTSGDAKVTDGKNLLQNAGAEEGNDKPDNWEQGAPVGGVTYSWDKQTASDGKASLCITKTAQTYFPIAQWSQTIEHDGKPRAVEFSAKIKAENAYKAILDVIFLDKDGNRLSHKWAAYVGAKKNGDPPANHDWKKFSGKVAVPKGTAKICFALQDYGPGTVWFDDVKAMYVPSASAGSSDDHKSAVASVEPSTGQTTSEAPDVPANDVDIVAKNLLKNPGVEEGKNDEPTAWEHAGAPDGAIFSWDKNVAYAGKASLSILQTASDSGNLGWFQTVDIKNESVVEFSALVKRENASQAAIQIRYMDRNGTILGGRLLPLPDESKAGGNSRDGWRRYSVKTIVPAEVRAGCYLYLVGPGKVWFDDMKATIVSTSNAAIRPDEAKSTGVSAPATPDLAELSTGRIDSISVRTTPPDGPATVELKKTEGTINDLVVVIAKKPKSEQEKLKAELTELVGRQFDIRQSIRKAEIIRLEQDLAKTKEMFEKKQENRDELVRRRVEKLLDSDVDE